MQSISENVRRDIIRLVPSSDVNEISCFVFYDNHPNDETKLDITICTTRGEIKEYYQRDLLQSLSIQQPVITNIELQRNSVGEIFYLVEVADNLYILSRRGKLQVHKRVFGVEKYEFEDFTCRGHAYLKVMLKDDAVPLIFDDNFKSLADEANVLLSFDNYDSIPVITDLARKWTEAKFNVKSNERKYEEVLKLRQKSALSNYHKTNPNVTDSLFGSEEECCLKIKSSYPVVRVCNKKIVIILEVFTVNQMIVDGVHVLLHRTHKSSLTYTTRLFEKTKTAPFWQEKSNHKVNSLNRTALAVIIDLTELKHDITNRIEFDGIVCYEYNGKEYSVPFESVHLSSSDTMRDDFDILCSKRESEQFTIIALLATTDKIDLCLRAVSTDMEFNTDISDIFCKDLQMEKFDDLNNMFVHKRSPHHPLYGVLIVLPEGAASDNRNLTLSLHTRLSTQVLALIHYINDLVPFRIIVTTVNQKITAKSDELCHYNEDIVQNPLNVNYVEYGTAIMNQTALALEYLDKCMVKMNESKDPKYVDKVGTEIDLFANGVEDFKEFKHKIYEEMIYEETCIENKPLTSLFDEPEGIVMEINDE